MRNLVFTAIFCILNIFTFATDKILQGADAENKIHGAEIVRMTEKSDLPCFVKFRKGNEINTSAFSILIKKLYKNSSDISLTLIQTDKDQLGLSHSKYQVNYKNIPLEYSIIIIHSKNNLIESFNGFLSDNLNVNTTPVISDKTAINNTLSKYNVSSEQLVNTPSGKLVLFPINNETHLAYKFNLFVSKPLKRADIYVDASSGNILYENNQIQFSDVTGTALTKYSGTQTITTDSYNSSFRLRETTRGNGIETYDMNLGSDYNAALDFTDADNYWNNVNTTQDEVATDAHWATEKTYDYYLLKHNRNSIDNNGFMLKSYVHADLIALGLTSNVNAFWNGDCMTYGDGNQNTPPLTALDICGHEVTHGLTEHTANLTYAEESGALNEGFSDIFGTCIEFFAKPAVANWTVGEDIGNAFRSLSDPASKGYPATYQGTNWDYNQEVHHNSTVLSHWFYLISAGGNGTNDFGHAYNITGLSIDTAAMITFRALTLYLTPSSNYADTRYLTIQATVDLFGACSPQVATVTNAWYAVNVGIPYVNSVLSNFTADLTSFCSAPATVHFQNLSSNGSSFLWHFGDGTTSTDVNPIHSYSVNGNKDVSLFTSGGTCGTDSIMKIDMISINPVNPCIIIMPQTGDSLITNCTGRLLDNGGMQNYSDNTDIYVTITPPGATSVFLTFNSFSFEAGFDYLYIYDGPDTLSSLIGRYDGNTLPDGGIITSTGGTITIRQTTDQGLTKSGFDLIFQCSTPNSPPIANFKANKTSTCTGEIAFTDLSGNTPTGWLWDFGDGAVSSLNNPVHSYNSSGNFTVSMIAQNPFGYDTIIKPNLIHVALPATPSIINDTVCKNTTAILHANGNGSINWFENSNGNFLFTGNDFTTPALSATTTYFAEDSIGHPIYFVGNTNATGNGNNFNANVVHFLKFNCYTPTVLRSVKVNAQGAGIRTIQLQDKSGNVLQSVSVDIPDGISRAILNFNLPVDSNLRLAGPNAPNLFRSNAGVNFPYSIPGIISITTSSAQTTPQNYYYYFYDWEVQEPTCISGRIPVTAFVENCSGVREITSSESLTLSPNPANESIYLKLNTQTSEPKITVVISDIHGKIFKTIKSEKSEFSIDIRELKSGVYYCKSNSNGDIKIKKIVVVRF